MNSTNSGDPQVSRRFMLKLTAAVAAATVLDARALLGQTKDWHGKVLGYLETLRRPDGGYAWADQPNGHLTPTFAAVGCYHALGQIPPRKKELAEFIRTHHPSQLKKLEQERRIFEYQQARSLTWLGEDASELKRRLEQWERPLAYLKQYEQHGHPLFVSEMGVLLSRALLGMPVDLPEFAQYLDSRRRTNGSFNNTPAMEGGDGHVVNTWWGLQVLGLLGRTAEKRQETVEWLQACQLASGGFTYQPKPAFAGVADVFYSWAALQGLRFVGGKAAEPGKALDSIHALWNADGGFGDRPGWDSNAVATYYAIEGLAALGQLGEEPSKNRLAASKPSRRTGNKSPSSELKVYSIQIEAHGRGSPAEAVELARSLKIHLWGAKGANAAWLKRAQALADAGKVPVQFFVSNEEYGTWVNVPGCGTYSHTSDIIAPAGRGFGPTLANQGVATWPEFRERRLRPLEGAGGRLIWQFGENEELVRLYLDDSIERGGYSAISTFHFGNPDFTNTEPFLKRYRGHIPFVALQDSHGTEPWWFADMTTGFRTLFLAREGTWESWLEALRNDWVVAVRHDAVSKGQTWMHAGSKEVETFVREREQQWRWWDNPDIRRPLLSLVAVKPEDEFEVGRPEKGAVLRVRCAWSNTPQGLAKEPLVEFVRLTVDGKEVSARLVERKQPRGANYLDHYHAFHLRETGKHTIEVTAKVVSGGELLTREMQLLV